MESTQDSGRGAGKVPLVPKKNMAGEPSGNEDSGKAQFKIDIFRGWCKCCGICAAFCPRQCIRLDEEGSPQADCRKCTGCGWCELHCPDFAISVRKIEDAGRTTEDRA